jgi:formylglycine-generating enzyme required for sulfatase activity
MEKIPLTYLDFDLEIGPGRGREYPVTVIRSPAGEARETVHFPYDELALENRLLSLQNALLRSGGQRRQVLSPEDQAVREFGQDLFEALVTGEVRSRYDVSLREAAQQGKGLRFKLRIQPPELAVLPWEFLYDPRESEYVSLSRNTPIVRYLELPRTVQPVSLAPPLRILGMMATPQDLPPLDVEREKQRVESALSDLQARGLIELIWLEGQTWRDLQRAMQSGPWHIFHFIGHGGFDRVADEGFVALADDDGETQRLSATHLGRLLADHHSLRLVLLNSCEGARGGQHDVFSSTASILARRGIPAVLAMQYEITDRAAIEFARAFYEAIAGGMPVDTAVAEGRKAISLAVANTTEWGTPVLYLRSDDGILFDIQAPPQTPAVATGSEPEAPRPCPRPPLVEPGIDRSWLRHRLPLALMGLPVLALLVGVALMWPRNGDPKVTSLETTTMTRDKDGTLMVYVPAGSFLMGSTRADINALLGSCRGCVNEQPQHEVTLSAFWIDQTEVTNAQYGLCVRDGICRNSIYAHDTAYNGDNYPVVGISWGDADLYCRWAGGRLPTEAEWEYAARGPQRSVYPWGEEFDCRRGNFDDDDQRDPYVVPGGVGCDGYERTAPVGSFPDGASWSGALDMSGNVWEWVNDWYATIYLGALWSLDNPTGPAYGTSKVLRGGSWFYGILGARTSFRKDDLPNRRDEAYGFRCAFEAGG